MANRIINNDRQYYLHRQTAVSIPTDGTINTKLEGTIDTWTVVLISIDGSIQNSRLSPRWFKWLTSNSPFLSPGFEPQVGRTLTLLKIKIKNDSIVESALQRG